ncbi:hypothetical protein MKY51_07515 [Solibacillus sp. FSL R5-0691]|uniref:hypothetical protein n=1 Tax=Solibacillus sp. FSL R5-0691 TaxID=2921653 RepID=UPI0030D53464
MKNKIFLRIILSLIVLILAVILIDNYSNGLIKNVLWGISVALVLLYNEKKNREYKKSKANN